MKMGRAVLDLIRFNRPIGSILLFLPALWGLLAAWNGSPPMGMVFLFAVGSFLMRSAGCAINDILDRKIDRNVSRTKIRPIPSGRLSVPVALVVFGVFILLSAFLLLFLNPLPRIIALFGFVSTAIYPLMKRFLPIPQLFMGIPFGMTAPLMAWAQGRGQLDWPGIAIGLAGLFWATTYDLVYAVADREDDIQAGVCSGAVTFGSHLWMAVFLFGFTSACFLWSAGAYIGFGQFFTWSVACFLGLISWQSWKLHSDLLPEKAIPYFQAHSWIGLIVAIGIWGEYPVLV
ncbi:MAG: 4-hydroxybenzoate octaprenyltransferase [Leptospirales bacterium]